MIKVVWPQPQTHALDSMRGDILGNRHGINFHIDVEFLVTELVKYTLVFRPYFFTYFFGLFLDTRKSMQIYLFFVF